MGGGISLRKTTDSEGQRPWKQLVNVIVARNMYVAEGSLRETCSERELECRVLLSDSAGFSNLEKFVEGKDKEHERDLLKRWTTLLCSYEQLRCAGIVDSICSFSETLTEARRGQVENALAELREDLMFCFDNIFRDIFMKFRVSDGYITMCDQLSQTNHVTSEDFDYFTKLGSGSFGCVFSCRKRSTGIMYAMKVQPKALLLHHLRDKPGDVMMELLASTGCPSPFVAQAAYAFQTPKLVFLALPLYTGGDLRRALNMSPGGYFPRARAQFYAAELASVLMFLHRNGLMHRDLKPENVFIDGTGHIVLGDLGSIADEKGRLQLINSVNSADPNISKSTTAVDAESMTTTTRAKIFSPLNAIALNEASANFEGLTSARSGGGGNSVNNGGNSSANSFSLRGLSAATSRAQLFDPNSTGAAGLSGAFSNAASNFSPFSFNPNPNPVGDDTSGHHSGSGSNSNSGPPSTANSYQCSYAFESRANGVVGTMRYMAPEVLALFADKDSRSKIRGCTPALDWFSYGVMLHEMLTGKCPYNASRSMTYQKLSQVYPAYLRLAGFDIDAVHKTVMGPFTCSDMSMSLLGVDGLALVRDLVELNPKHRMGLNKNCFPTGETINDVYSELKADPFFDGIDWEAVFERRMKPVMTQENQEIHIRTDTVCSIEEMLERAKKPHWRDDFDTREEKGGVPAAMRTAAEKLIVKPDRQHYFADWQFVHSSAVAEEKAKGFQQFPFFVKS